VSVLMNGADFEFKKVDKIISKMDFLKDIAELSKKPKEGES